MEEDEDLRGTDEYDEQYYEDNEGRGDPVTGLLRPVGPVHLLHCIGVTKGSDEAEVAQDEDDHRQEDGDGRPENSVAELEGLVAVDASGGLDAVEASAVVDGAQPELKFLAAVRDDVVVPEPREVDEQRADIDERYGDTCGTEVDESSRVERPTDRHVTTEGHDDRQPGAAQEKDVDERFLVGVEVCLEEEIARRVGRFLSDDRHEQVDQTEQHVGHGQGHETDVVRSLHRLHRTLQLLPGQHEQVKDVPDDPEHADRRNKTVVDDVFDQTMALLFRLESCVGGRKPVVDSLRRLIYELVARDRLVECHGSSRRGVVDV